MKFCVLASGSKGNCTYIEIKNHKFLIDVGTNFLYISKKLSEINVKPSEIEAIFITHSHTDHTSALKRIIKNINPKIYLSSKTKAELNVDLENYELIDENIEFDNFIINTIKLSHDVNECLGYIFNNKIVYITDTGYINNKYHEILKNKEAYIIESNHDVDMLMESNRPYFLKMRILGDEGHISNKDCGYYLSKFIGDNTKHIVLAHLSENNNTKEKALDTVLNYIEYEKNICVAMQNERTEVIEV
ncbi:MAG: MBL fold metallo-hydrolase [Bacilli bacterium]|jgi:phosphoribosyl 1,2-cyclic phosphodiesterase|nr:MBL fold metallo-hydrolase [Bacilli bacterium]